MGYRITASMTALGVAAALALSACTTGDETMAGSGGKVEIEEVGLMVQDLSNPFFAAMQDAVEQKGEELGIEVNVQDGRQDLAAQNDQIDAFIQQGVDVILLNAVDSEGIASAVARAKAEGIIVIAVDVGAEGADATVTTDNVEAGKVACEYLIEQMGGEGNMLIVDGTPITSVQDRVEGCEQVLEEYPDVEVVGKQAGNNDRATALRLATDMLTANSDVDGIFGINDPSALGATLAVEQADRSGIQITGVDGAPEAVTELQKEESPFIGTSAQDPGRLALEGLEIAQQIADGKEPEDTEMLIPTKLITADNVDSYEGWS